MFGLHSGIGNDLLAILLLAEGPTVGASTLCEPVGVLHRVVKRVPDYRSEWRDSGGPALYLQNLISCVSVCGGRARGFDPTDLEFTGSVVAKVCPDAISECVEDNLYAGRSIDVDAHDRTVSRLQRGKTLCVQIAARKPAKIFDHSLDDVRHTRDIGAARF